MIRAWLAGFGVAAIVQSGGCSDSKSGVPPVRKEPAHEAPLRADAAPRTFVGVITPADVVDVASKLDGVVAAVNVRVGDNVVAGQVVVQLDPRPIREHVSAAAAAVAAAQAASKQAALDVEDARRRVAVDTKAVANGGAHTALDEAQLALKRAEAATQQAAATRAAESARLQMARDQLSDLSLRAISDGVVAMRFKDPGATITAGDPIVRIVGRREPQLRFAVPPDDVRAVEPGTQVTAVIETISAPTLATVREVSSTIDTGSGMIIVEAELPPDALGAGLRPGLAATITLVPSAH